MAKLQSAAAHFLGRAPLGWECSSEGEGLGKSSKAGRPMGNMGAALILSMTVASLSDSYASSRGGLAVEPDSIISLQRWQVPSLSIL